MKALRTPLILFIIGALVLSACEQSRVYDKNMSIDASGWAYGERLTFEVMVNDTALTYNMFINVRHRDTYPYNNLWLDLTTQFPDSTSANSKVNVELSEPEGEWTGNCVDGICYNSVLIQKNFRFPAEGKYLFTIEQDMRMNPLPGLMDVGMRVEKFAVAR